MVRTNFEIALLGFLLKGPKHGYDLHKELSDPNGIGGVWHVKIGKMYSMLKKLESEGFIHASTGQDGNRPPKIIYLLTDQGKNVFIKWMYSPIKHGRDIRILFLMKIYLIKNNKSFNEKQIILQQKAECESWKKRYRSDTQERNEEKSFNEFVRNYRSSQINGFINWLDWCREAIGEKHEE